ncbi:MAG: hypothetical protein JXB10_19205 [Pirellulales bacterium]|nr:hypothetical protein [Pirellulales bacterium]
MVRFLSPDRKIIVHAAHEQVGVSVMRQAQPSQPVPLFPPRLWIVGPPSCRAALNAFQTTQAELLFQSGIFGDTEYAWEEKIQPVVHDSMLLVGSNHPLPPAMLQTILRHHREGGAVLGVTLSAPSLAGEEALLTEVFGATFGLPLSGGRFEIRPAATAGYHPILHGVSAFVTETSFPSCRLGEKTVATLVTAHQGGLRLPVSWVKTCGGLRRFGALLGAPHDFHKPGFLTLLRNAVLWTRGEI